MIKCNLSTRMGSRKLKIADVASATGLNRSLVSALYYERAQRVDLDAVERLCRLFECSIGEFFELVDADTSSPGQS